MDWLPGLSNSHGNSGGEERGGVGWRVEQGTCLVTRRFA